MDTKESELDLQIDKQPVAPVKLPEGAIPEGQIGKDITAIVDSTEVAAEVVAVDETIEPPKKIKPTNLRKEKYETAVVKISPEQRQLLEETRSTIAAKIEGNYQKGFGVCPSAKGGNFDEQLWIRDCSHAIGNYLAVADPKAVEDSLRTIFHDQREDGAIPYKIEKRYGALQIIPKVGKSLSKSLFKLIRKGKERPEYEGDDLNGAEDTIPDIVLATSEYFFVSEAGKKFVAEHYEHLKKAISFFRKKLDPKDSLAVVTKYGPDWTETINRKGKLGTINILWARSLRSMQYMAQQLGKVEDAKAFEEEYEKVKASVLGKIYNKADGYFRAKAGEDRLDTGASVFGSLFILGPEEAVRVEESLRARVLHSSGLKNFDPPYADNEIQIIPRLFGNKGYHNENVWPWVTCQNIQVKIKIALSHPDEATRNKYKKEAIEDLIAVSELFKKVGGACEVVKADEPKPASAKFLGIKTYTPVKNFMGSMVAYEGVYQKLKELGWI